MKSSTSFLLLTLLFCPNGLAAETSTHSLWPSSSLPHDGKGDVPELIVTQVDSDQPTAGVVILPGGGYRGHAMDHEGHQFAKWFADRGVTSAICTYRLRGKGNEGKGYGHPYPMLDAQRAIQTLRANAKKWNIDPKRIGVIGFSAGGHLCSTVSTHFADPKPDSDDLITRVSSRPDFAILCYPVIAFGQPFTHGGSQRNLLGPDPDPELIEQLSNERQVTEQTPPSFLFHTIADKVVSVENSMVYFQACRQNDVPVEMHLFQEGRHGLGLAGGQPGSDQWPALCESWLRRLGIVTNE
ncbi:MAG: alpha/beta hydrolase [Planctomycetota bacterium]